MTKQRLYKVYWIKTSEMTDVYTQGYVGMTKRSIKYRLGQHYHSKRPIGSILRGLPKEEVQIVELYRGYKEVALEKEYMYRPTRYIGWNIQAGGDRPTVVCKNCGKHLAHGVRNIRHLCPDCNPDDGRFKKGHVPHNAGKGEKYLLVDPEGVTYTPERFTVFCKEHNLTPQNLRKVAKGLRKHHKGWTAVKLTV
jgi:hypothetical protein